MYIHTRTCTQTCLSALFLISKICKQPISFQWRNGQPVGQPHHSHMMGFFSAVRKEQIIGTCSDTDGSQSHRVERRMPIPEGSLPSGILFLWFYFYDICMTFREREICSHGERASVHQECRGGRNWHRQGARGAVLCSDHGDGTCICTHVKTAHQKRQFYYLKMYLLWMAMNGYDIY